MGDIITKELSHSYEIVTVSRSNSSEIKCDLSKNIPLLPRVNFVIHAAGKAHIIPKNKKESEEFHQVNYHGTVNLTKALENTGLPSVLIYISSVAVYGKESGTDITEDQTLNGNSPYADSKKKAEEYLINWGKKINIKIGILRLPLISGPNPHGNLKVMIDGIRSGNYFRITGNEARKSMVNGKDIVNILEPLAARGGIYNLTDGYHPGISELENVISKAYNKKIRAIPESVARIVAKTGDLIGRKFPINSERLRKLTSTLTFSDEKARRELGWNPTPVLDHLYEILK